MTRDSIAIPEERHSVFEFRQRDLPGFATVNVALSDFAAREAFRWHLSVLIQCKELVENRLPSHDEQNLLYEFEDKLDLFIGADQNAIFFARVTHGGNREVIWRVREPEAANAFLRRILEMKRYPREFEYRMDDDPKWERAAWYLNAANSG